MALKNDIQLQCMIVVKSYRGIQNVKRNIGFFRLS